jgi:hypothetical protein
MADDCSVGTEVKRNFLMRTMKELLVDFFEVMIDAKM